jgi:8-oxo-dGTP pyrophosphatase MutT (NUDIX family)
MAKAVVLYLTNMFGQVLTVTRRNQDDSFGLVGGKVDAGESDREALNREVFEETGVNLAGVSHTDMVVILDNGVPVACFIFESSVSAMFPINPYEHEVGLIVSFRAHIYITREHYSEFYEYNQRLCLYLLKKEADKYGVDITTLLIQMVDEVRLDKIRDILTVK